MNIRTTISPAILTAATAMLQQYVPELSPQTLTEALKNYESNASCKAPAAEKPLTRKECSALLGVSLASINRYIRQGRIKAKKISSRLVRIDPQSVRDLLNCNREDAAL